MLDYTKFLAGKSASIIKRNQTMNDIASSNIARVLRVVK